MKKNSLSPSARFEHFMKQLETKPINEICTFTSKHRSLYTRFHLYRKDNKVAESMRELLDLGLKAKGY